MLRTSKPCDLATVSSFPIPQSFGFWRIALSNFVAVFIVVNDSACNITLPATSGHPKPLLKTLSARRIGLPMRGRDTIKLSRHGVETFCQIPLAELNIVLGIDGFFGVAATPSATPIILTQPTALNYFCNQVKKRPRYSSRKLFFMGSPSPVFPLRYANPCGRRPALIRTSAWSGRSLV